MDHFSLKLMRKTMESCIRVVVIEMKEIWVNFITDITLIMWEKRRKKSMCM